MRIIAGKFKKTSLLIPKKISFRPTSDYVKESFFSSISNAIEDSIFLDLFSGSGNIGIEALSRGANKVFFVDKSIESIKILKNNLKSLKIEDNSFVIIRNDFKKAIKNFFKEKIYFDIIYADPPYEKNFSERILSLLKDFLILKKNGIIAIEHSKRESFNYAIKELVLFKILEYGDTKITILKRS